MHATAALVVFSRRGCSVRRADNIDTLVALSALLGVISACLAANAWLAVRSVSLGLSCSVMLWCLRGIKDPAHRIEQGIVAASLIAACVGIGEGVGLLPRLSMIGRGPGGLLGNRNCLGHLLVCTSPGLIWGASIARSWRSRATTWLTIVISACGVIVSRSRLAWMALAFTWVIYAVSISWRIVIARRPIHRAIVVPMVLCGLGIVSPLAIPQLGPWKVRRAYIDSAERLVDLRSGTGRERILQYRNSIGALSERGLFAGVLAVMLLAALTKGALRGLASPREVEWLTGTLLLALLGAVSIVGCGDAFLALPQGALFVTATLAVFTRIEPAEWMARTRAGRYVMGACTLLPTVACARSALQSIAVLVGDRATVVADRHLAVRLDPGNYRLQLVLARELIRRNECIAARPHIAAATRLFPHEEEPRALAQYCEAVEPTAFETH